MATSLMPEARQRYYNNAGEPLALGLLYTYAAGTSTPKATYTDSAGLVPHANPIVLDAKGEAVIYWNGAYKVDLKTADGVQITGYPVDNYTPPTDTLRTDLAASSGSSLIGYIATGAGAVTRTLQNKARENPTVADYGTTGDGTVDDTGEIISAVTNLPQRGKLTFTPATAYKITGTIEVFNKAGSVIDFGNQQINASEFTSPAPALHFKTISQACIDNIFVIGDTTNVNAGVLFDAAAGEITIHAKIGKVNVSSCDTGIVVGTATHQFADSQMEDLYASDCNTGIRFTGENTLAMDYGRVAAYNNTTIGTHFEQGGGTIKSLQVAASGNDLYFGSTSGLNHDKLERWDIMGGYSEQGVNGERFIDSVTCADTNPFLEQVTIRHFRVTPFTSTNVGDFIRWRMNGDLILKNVSINHGQQEPYISLDHNTSYRAPRVVLDDCVIDCAPTSATQVAMTYKLTDPRQVVEINARVNNGISFWQNDGSANEGTIKRGIYMHKLAKFEQALLSIGNLIGAWNLRDITSGTCRNLVLGGPSLTTSATLERRDFWLDDGLVGFFRNSTTSKTASSSDSALSAGERTFGCILRTTPTGVDETDNTNLGGTGAMRLGIGDTAGAFARCTVGAVSAEVAPTNPLDPHLLIGRYVPSTSVEIDCINLRTGEVLSASVAGPALVDFTWTDGLSIRNDLCVRGFPFVYGRALTDVEVSSLLQAAMQLTDSWRLA